MVYLCNQIFVINIVITKCVCNGFIQLQKFRLDFNNFVLNSPNVVGVGAAGTVGLCFTDTAKINAGGSTGTLVPPVPGLLCGTNSGSHGKVLKNISSGNK